MLFVLIVLAGTAGELCVARAMKTIGESRSFHPAAVARTLLKALRVPWMYWGILLMAIAFFSLLGALSFYNVSFVVPVTALSYVAGAFGSAAFLRERVTPHRWVGIALVAVGVTLVLLGKS
jgi:drug/metabolite transporter (DMT)-like permease